MSYSRLSDKYTVWPQLEQHRESWKTQTLANLFKEDNNRCARFSVNAAGLELDFSKNHITTETLQLLLEVARQADLGGAIKRLLKGDHVNATEDRPALHTALRHTGAPVTAEQKAVAETLDKMSHLIASVHNGDWTGYTGKRITDVVNIGIGGSDLGPRMVTKALTPYLNTAVKVHFVANIDGAELTDTLSKLDPASSLFIVASKSFSTQETRENALSARTWMLESGCPQQELKSTLSPFHPASIKRWNSA
ncbi:MAG: hypothetical protein NVV73_05190 [Cellvibrionaceae bacterium]|nr:hypothetical protein [Cellvibrionaceae bacterium]